MSVVLERWKVGLARSSQAALGRLADVLGFSTLNQENWDDLEAILIQSDLGLDTTSEVLSALRKKVDSAGKVDPDGLRRLLKQVLLDRLVVPMKPDFPSKPAVVFLVGVNGSGKTTTVAKLGKRFLDSGKSVLLIGADTFRAAATDQLQVWAKRLNLPMIAGQMGSDSGAVVYDGIQSAIAKGTDIVLVDTAGRLHTRFNLMEELKKVIRVAGKIYPGAPHAIWLVIDATMGQNALLQARAFNQAVAVNGVILAKLDTSARGGMAFAINSELGLPILFAGLGEKPEDLEPFDPQAFIDVILATN